MVVLNQMDLQDGGSGSNGMGGSRGTPRGSGPTRVRAGNQAYDQQEKSGAAMADVIACATTGFSIQSLGRKLSNSQLMNPGPTSALMHRHHHHQQQHHDHQLQARVMSQSSSSGSGSSRLQPLSLLHSNQCAEDEDESLSVQTPVYEAIDPARLVGYATLFHLQVLLLPLPACCNDDLLSLFSALTSYVLLLLLLLLHALQHKHVDVHDTGQSLRGLELPHINVTQ